MVDNHTVFVHLNIISLSDWYSEDVIFVWVLEIFVYLINTMPLLLFSWSLCLVLTIIIPHHHFYE